MTKYESRFGSADPTLASRIFYRFVRALILGAAKVIFRLEIHGRERLPADGAYVLAPGAHRSNIEIFVVCLITTRRLRYMGKDSVWKHAASDWFFSSLGGFPVNRDGADREALNQTLDIVAGGEPVVMFPEGTRRTGPTIDPEHLRDGVAYVASRAQIPIVPLGIGGSEKAMPPGAKYLRPTKMVLVVGDPMAPPPLKESGRVSRSGMRATTAELRTRLQALFDDAQRRAGHLAP
jgi:1-acyl-sn-glycerol-3-phosphate acyltransferase